MHNAWYLGSVEAHILCALIWYISHQSIYSNIATPNIGWNMTHSRLGGMLTFTCSSLDNANNRITFQLIPLLAPARITFRLHSTLTLGTNPVGLNVSQCLTTFNSIFTLCGICCWWGTWWLCVILGPLILGFINLTPWCCVNSLQI